jgi:hypothetical protein
MRWREPRPDAPRLPSSSSTHAAVVDDLLKLGGGSAAMSGCQVYLSAYVHVIEAGNIGDERN